ncbi:MAG: tRNA 2-thiocytidine biosynthesis protein TtcA [Spirochaetes bacterium]|nr:tRNA 2-thiocytidine biosynthesis protein TtcA [Spirochaetota bacterium]
MSKFEEKLSKRIGKTIFDHKMIEDNDKILIGASGGKDSLLLLYDLYRRAKVIPVKYEIVVAHIVSDFADDSYLPGLENLFKEYGVEYKIIRLAIDGRLKEGKKLNCYWCSMQRRIELMKLAKSLGCSKLALGHNLDDVVETFLMNLFNKSEIATMLPVMKYKKFDLTIIRPLADIKEKDIERFAKEKSYQNLSQSCPLSALNQRKSIKKIIDDLSKINPNIRENIANSTKNINLEYILR